MPMLNKLTFKTLHFWCMHAYNLMYRLHDITLLIQVPVKVVKCQWHQQELHLLQSYPVSQLSQPPRKCLRLHQESHIVSQCLINKIHSFMLVALHCIENQHYNVWEYLNRQYACTGVSIIYSIVYNLLIMQHSLQVHQQMHRMAPLLWILVLLLVQVCHC